jgi:predicted phage tail protein
MVAFTKRTPLKSLNMKVVKVYGELKKRLGQGRFELDVATPAEAIRALCANFPGLQRWIIDSEQDGIGYKVKVGRETIGEENLEELHYPWSERDVFSITPVLAGAGRGWGKVIVGALLVTAAIVFAPAGTGFMGLGSQSVAPGVSHAFTMGAAASSFVGSVGAAMMLSGVAEMLSPVPKMPEDPEQLQSFSFSGIVNTSKIGSPVPIAYGRVFVGSSVISSGLDVDQLV